MKLKSSIFWTMFICLVVGGGLGLLNKTQAAVRTVGSQACKDAGDCGYLTISSAINAVALDDEILVKNSYNRDVAGEDLGVTLNWRVKFSCEDDTVIIGPSSGDSNTNYSSSTHLGFVGGSEVTGCTFSNISIFVGDGFTFKNNHFVTSSVGTVMSTPNSFPVVIENNTDVDSINISNYSGAAVSSTIKNNYLSALEVRSEATSSAGNIEIYDNNFEVVSHNQINLVGYNINFYNNQVVYNNSEYSDNSGGIMVIDPYGSMSITTNTISMATVSNRDHFRAISGGFNNKTRSLLLVGNKIDFRNATGDDTLPIRLDSYCTTTEVSWNISHNTFFYNYNGQNFIELLNKVDGGKISVSNYYNIFNSAGDNQMRRVFNITNDYDNSDTYVAISSDYNDYYNLNPNSGNSDGRVDVIATRKCNAGNCDNVNYSYFDSGSHSVLTQPVFQSASTGILAGWTLVPYSTLFDVNGTEDIGAIAGERASHFLVGDQTWYKNFTNTTTGLALYSTSSMFGSSDSTTTWTYVGEDPTLIINNNLKNNDAVAVFPGSYGPVNISNSVQNVVIGNYAWGTYLPMQLQTKLWGLSLANSGSSLSSYDCQSVYAVLLDMPVNESGTSTVWDGVQENCQAQQILNGAQSKACASRAAYIDYVCSAPTQEDEKAIFKATTGNAFTATGLTSSTIFGLTFSNATTTAFNAIASAHYYSTPVITAATVSQHYYTAGGHDYNYVMDNGGDGSLVGLNFWTYYQQTPIAVTSTDLTRAMTVMPSAKDLTLFLTSLDMSVLSGGAVTGTVYATMYVREDMVTTTLPSGFTIDCLADDTFTYANGSYTYHAPTCGGLGAVTTSGTPAIGITEVETPYTEFFYGGEKAQANSSMLIFDLEQLGGGNSEEDPGLISSSANTDVTNYLGGSTPLNWHLMIASIDTGVSEMEGVTGVIAHMALYLRSDVLPTETSLSDFANLMASQFSTGVSILCLKENVFSYSNGAFSYNAPTGCNDITINGTPTITLAQSGYAGLKLIDSHDNDFYANNAQNNGYGVWLDGNSYNNTFVGSITPNLATEEGFWNGSLSGTPDVENPFSSGMMRAASIVTYAYSSSTLLKNSFGGVFESPNVVLLPDSDLAIDTPFNITNSTIADVKNTVSGTGHNSFYNVDANLAKVITNSTAPTNMYYRARVRSTNTSNATLKSANDAYVFSDSINSDGYTDYSNNFLAASLYTPNNTSITSGGNNPYIASASSYTNSANLVSANQVFVLASSGSNSGGGSGPNNLVAMPNVKVPPYIKSISSSGVALVVSDVEKATQMAISFDANFTGGIWINYSSSTKITLVGTYGEKKIYVKFRTATGGTSLVYIVKATWNKTGEVESGTSVVKVDNQDVKVEQPAVSTIPAVNQIYLFKRTFKLGAVGDDVRALQQILREGKYFIYYKNTGYFGAATKSALIKYQTAKGLKATGVVDNATVEYFKTGIVPAPEKFVFKRNLKLGAVGDDVRALQQILREGKYFIYYKNTGYFGAATKSALIKYQTAKGLKATGVVDNATLEVLNG